MAFGTQIGMIGMNSARPGAVVMDEDLRNAATGAQQRMSPTGEVLSALEAQIVRLLEEIDTLTQRLEPVLGPPIPEPSQAVAKEAHSSAMLIVSLTQKREGVALAAMRLAMLRERLVL